MLLIPVIEYEEGTIKLIACPLVIGLWQQPTIPVNHGGGKVDVGERLVVEDGGVDGLTDVLADTVELSTVLADTDELAVSLADDDTLATALTDADELAVAVSVVDSDYDIDIDDVTPDDMDADEEAVSDEDVVAETDNERLAVVDIDADTDCVGKGIVRAILRILLPTESAT